MVDETRPLGRKIWASVQGEIVPGSLLRQGGGLSVLVRSEDGSEVRVRGEEGPYASMISGALSAGGPVIFQGLLVGSDQDGDRHLSVRVEGAVTLTGEVSEIDRSGEGEPPRVSFWMLRELTSDRGETRLIGTGVNVYGADADAVFGLRAGDRVTVEARHGPDGFIATSPLTIMDD